MIDFIELLYKTHKTAVLTFNDSYQYNKEGPCGPSLNPFNYLCMLLALCR